MAAQNEIAAKLGVSIATVSYLMSGKRRPSWGMAKRLSEHFGRSPTWWMESDSEAVRRQLTKEGQKWARAIG